jgi:hypothetical protein
VEIGGFSVPLGQHAWLPARLSDQGQLGARFGAESLLSRFSAQLETAMPWADRHPPISL